MCMYAAYTKYQFDANNLRMINLMLHYAHSKEMYSLILGIFLFNQ